MPPSFGAGSHAGMGWAWVGVRSRQERQIMIMVGMLAKPGAGQPVPQREGTASCEADPPVAAV